ncbi:MAG: hypothetical protein KatS3mg027_0342 [Bacteroidia bacterium]|nr:MAG: hypothetical protein KatS3mg027_0342 [Bacteroidia bacterium]
MPFIRRIYIYIYCLFFASAYSQNEVSQWYQNPPKKYTIAGIEIEGVENIDKNVLKYLTGISVGDVIQIPGDKTADAIKNLMKQGMFDDVELYVDKIVKTKHLSE